MTGVLILRKIKAEKINLRSKNVLLGNFIDSKEFAFITFGS